VRQPPPYGEKLACIASVALLSYTDRMKTFTVRLPEHVVADIEAESEERRISKSDVVRERLQTSPKRARPAAAFEAIAHLIGSVDELPGDLSARKKHYLRTTGYGRNRSR
jgi:Arc/MetJ-type ribon-helix-helix transcriptional regulator